MWYGAGGVQVQYLAGVLSAFAVSYIGIGASFCLQNLMGRDTPKLTFGMHSLALGVCAVAVAVNRASNIDSYWIWTVATGAELLAVALMLHFALLFSQAAASRHVAPAVYGVTALLQVASLWRGLVRPASAAGDGGSGWVLEHVATRVTPLGGLAWMLASAGFLATVGLLARAVRRGRREARGPLVGSIVATAIWCRDALVVLGAVDGHWLGPLGSGVLVVSVADAYLFRHARLSRDLQRDYVQLRDAQRELRRKEQLTAIGELAAVVAHEIRNPLAIISNSVAGLRRRDLPGEEKETLMRILGEESARLNGLISNLLTYVRPVVPRPQQASIRELLRRTMLSTSSKGPLEFEITADTGAEQVSVDPNLLRHVLDNLVDNAGHAMNWRGTVQIAVRAETKGNLRGVTISVRDRGEGMNAEVCARAKNPFFTTRPTGTGLGLAIVDRIIEAHGGELTIESAVGLGTTAMVFIPDADAAETADRERSGVA
jgi:signal transduction histidine kinase